MSRNHIAENITEIVYRELKKCEKDIYKSVKNQCMRASHSVWDDCEIHFKQKMTSILNSYEERENAGLIRQLKEEVEKL